MARFVLKWRYFKSSPKRNSQYLKYIATRDGVEKCDESWRYQPATIEQKRIIDSLIKDFPDAISTPIYEDYLSNKTKGLASELIDDTLEEYFDLIDKKENYIGYIAKRPRVEKQGTHGLFSLHDEEINLESVAKDIANHDGLVFTTIMSLKRNDAEALDYTRSIRWKELLKRNTIAIAKSMNISPSDLRWYAAFHNETYHPHIHLVAYSVGREPYITEKRLDDLKRTFAKDIFSSEMHNIYVEQTDRRNELRKEAENKIEEVVSLINEGHYSNPIVADLLKQLVSELDNYSGRMMYGYLPKRAKNLIDGIVDEMAADEKIKELYELWYEKREIIVKIYREEMPPRVPLSSNKEFKSIRNAVLQEALRLKDISEYPFTDENVEKIYLPEKAKVPVIPASFQPSKKYHWKTDIALSSARLFARLTQAIQDNFEEDRQTDQQVDKKVLKRIQEKKQLQGIKM